MKAYIDIDSCYYNIVRRLYHASPWTIITNRLNHMISVPCWLEGRLGVKKITYFAPSAETKLKVSKLVNIFNIDTMPDARNSAVKFMEDKLEDVKALAPDARLAHKDSIAVSIKYSWELSAIEKMLKLPHTTGVGANEEEAKNDCKAKKLKRKSRAKFMNGALFIFWIIPMIANYIFKRRKSK